MTLTNQLILNHIENWRATLAKRDVDAVTVLASIEDAIIYGEEPEPGHEPEPAVSTSKIVVTKYHEAIGIHTKTYAGADAWHVGGEGLLEVSKDGDTIACHAAGEWSAVEYIGE